MSATVSFALILALPVVGASADRSGRHKPALMGFTVLCVAMTALLGVADPLLLALAGGAIATFAFNTADSQYHPLLAVVAPEDKRGRVSGIGVAVGYLGTLMALFALGAVIDDVEAQKAFLPAAAMFGVFALPCFLLVRERARRPREDMVPRTRPLAQLLAERIGPRQVVLGTLAVTVVTLLVGAGTGSSALLWVVGPLVGIALGSLSTVDRIFLLRLVPEERRGEDFSLYALVGKLSGGFGPLVLWGGTILVMTELAGLSSFDASRVAVAVLAGAALLGLLILRPLSDRSRVLSAA